MTLRPMLGAEIDLRDFAYMPLDVVRLRDSDLAAVSTGDGFRAAVLLWCAAWHQVPASSLPNDDRVLSRLAGYGRDMAGWELVKGEAMRGFVVCDDGRLYHPTIAEKALEGWLEKLGQRKSSAAGNAKRYGQEFDAAPYDAAIENAAAMLTALNPNSRAATKRVPKGPQRQPNRTPEPVPTGSQEKGTEGKGREDNTYTHSVSSTAREKNVCEELWLEFEKEFPWSPGMSKAKAKEVFEGKIEVSQRAAIAGISELRKRKPTTYPLSAERYLAEDRFESCAPAAAPQAALDFYVSPQTPEWEAWRQHRKGKSLPMDAKGGWPVPSLWPPGHERALGAA